MSTGHIHKGVSKDLVRGPFSLNVINDPFRNPMLMKVFQFYHTLFLLTTVETSISRVSPIVLYKVVEPLRHGTS